MKAIFFLTSSNSPSGLLELHARLGVLDRGLEAGLGGAGAAGAERGAAEVEHGSATRRPLPSGPRMFSLRHRHVGEREPAGGGAADAALVHARLDDLEAGHVGRDEERRDLAFRRARRPGVRAITVRHVGDAAVGDVALLAVEDARLAVGARRGRGLHVAGVGAGFGFGEREGAELLAVDQVGQPACLLLLGAEEEQGADADRVVGVDEDGRRRRSGRR